MVWGCLSVAIGDVVELASCVLIYVFPFNCHFPLWPHLVFVFLRQIITPSFSPVPAFCFTVLFFGPYCSADLDRRSLVISNRNHFPTQEMFLVSDSIRLPSQISDFPIADRAHSGTPLKRHNPSCDQSFCGHDRDHNFDRAIRCAESLPCPIFLRSLSFRALTKLPKVIQYLSNNNPPPPHQMGVFETVFTFAKT